jgi:hypothetical protein
MRVVVILMLWSASIYFGFACQAEVEAHDVTTRAILFLIACVSLGLSGFGYAAGLRKN